jgi:hypothetical protein
MVRCRQSLAAISACGTKPRQATQARLRDGSPFCLILRQNVDATQLLLNLLDTPDGAGPFNSLDRICHRGPAGIAWDDRN